MDDASVPVDGGSYEPVQFELEPAKITDEQIRIEALHVIAKANSSHTIYMSAENIIAAAEKVEVYIKYGVQK